ncbi:hypothetical protein HEP86_36720 [Streptomyces sp. RPA4-5]|uniref:hypothetical protein n=1 Tax=Streptomyces sp. RPA4-5 TaxID=2721245 RepID=UPI00143ED5E0|nr:hypothetical protein [Streptomyces sp. RPA4-5]QIY53187.1 hypothetical protein HEP86_36720 [Streptomyces sp. RPA4-5]
MARHLRAGCSGVNRADVLTAGQTLERGIVLVLGAGAGPAHAHQGGREIGRGGRA